MTCWWTKLVTCVGVDTDWTHEKRRYYCGHMIIVLHLLTKTKSDKWPVPLRDGNKVIPWQKLCFMTVSLCCVPKRICTLRMSLMKRSDYAKCLTKPQSRLTHTSLGSSF